MLGAICGDIIGSVYEHDNVKSKAFPLFSKTSKFTDDTVLTAAIADSLIHKRPYGENIKRFYRLYPKAGYGFMFSKWARSKETEGYFSYGNGSAMRVSPVAWAFNDLDKVMSEALQSACATHNHPEGVKGAQAIAGAIFLAKQNGSKDDIKSLAETLGYKLDFTLDDIRADYHFDSTCQGSVPQAITALLESTDFEDAIRNAVSIGGDSDTIACMAASIAEAFYGGVPDDIETNAKNILDSRLDGILTLFRETFLETNQ